MVWVEMPSSARRANRSCRVVGMGEGSKLRGFRDGGVVRLARLLLAEPPPTRQQTRPHARCLAARTGTSLLGNPVVWPTFLAQLPGPVVGSWGQWPAAPTIPMLSARAAKAPKLVRQGVRACQWVPSCCIRPAIADLTDAAGADAGVAQG